jgi:DmsE family decaheme c-type cytochrome
MRSSVLWSALAFAVLAGLATSATAAENKFRLKPGAEGKVCLDCHSDFAQKLKSRFVHTPVKSGECTGCHSPHASAHGKLLSSSTGSMCLTCHDGVIPEKAVSSHKVVMEGNCVTCHDPHASDNKANLRKAGNDLCVGCHKAVGDTVARVKFKHLPVSDGCLNCHNPHGSDKAPHLLTEAVPSLCVQCHKPDSPSFTRQHASYPVARANCVSCHDVHGSNTAAILFDTVHPPVAAKRCNQCHNAATAAEPFATRRGGYELCRGCHSTMVNETFAKARVHWPLVDKTGCLSCHEAHASRQKKLLNVPQATLCGECHRDTVEWQARLGSREKEERAALTKARVEKGALTHQPIQQGNCSACHMPHASDNVYLMRSASFVEGCGSCHDWLKHNSHPMGEKVADMRNRNRSVDCLSCHRAHGTGYRYMIPFPATTELCVQCHKQLRR